MRQILRLSGQLSALCLLVLCAWGAGEPVQHFAWKDAGIGTPPADGIHTWDTTTLTLSGAGAGLNVHEQDQVQFVSVPHPAGDFEIVARMKSISTDGEVTAGIMARADETPQSNMVALYFALKNHSINWMSRLPGETSAHPRVPRSGCILVHTPGVPEPPAGSTPLPPRMPLWMRLVRLGKNFSVYKSRDGKLWSMISNMSGGPIGLDGPFLLGFFVSRPGGGMATVTFDAIQITPVHLQYRTSWVGNTFGCRDEDHHVSNGLAAMWVGADGACYCSSYWDEGGAPVTSYRDGKVVSGLPIGTPQTTDGGITGDRRQVYVACVDHITVVTPSVPGFAPRDMHLSVNLQDKTMNGSVVSGMASNGKELFVSDARENVIRVATTEPAATLQVGGNSVGVYASSPVSAPTDDPHYAPSIVYQSQRVGENFSYSLPGFTPGQLYTLRCHLAEYVKRPANDDPRSRIITINGQEMNIAELAGGVLKAAYKDLPNTRADATGHIPVHCGSLRGPGVCGFEVLDQAGKRVFALNCGGPVVGDFKGECEELTDRAFKFARPGEITIDKRGDLWIVQRGNDHPMNLDLPAKYPAAVKCYHPDGAFTGRAITDVVNPRALAYDAATDRLLVGETGPDQQVRFYHALDTTPTLADTFGSKGGIFSGKPGLVDDPDAGGYARFAGIFGLGMDAQGNLYVGGGFQGTDLRKFTPDGKCQWMLNSLMFCDTYDVDPASDGADLYGTYNHLKLDLTQTEAGKEQHYVGYNWDLRKFGLPVRAGTSQAIVRRLGPEKRLLMFTTGQGAIGDINIYRYDGEIAIPCGGIIDKGANLWVDANGDGQLQPDEKTKMETAIRWITSLVVDAHGDLWVTVTDNGGSFIRHFFFKGFNDNGVPRYSGIKGSGYVDVPYPEEGAYVNGRGMASRMDYDADRDILVAYYPAVPRTGDNDSSAPQYYLACYPKWSKGNRTPAWKIPSMDPQINPDNFMYETNFYPYRSYMGLQIAGDYVFFAFIFGEVHVFDLRTGKQVQTLAIGPEINGQCAWEDAAMGLRAFKRHNGEYLIFTENSGWGGKNNFFRWKPD